MPDPRRDLPSVDRLLRQPDVAVLLAIGPRDLVVRAARESVEAARRLRSGPPDDWAADIRERLERRSLHSLRPVLNATGVVLHTNLGRAPLADTAIEAMTVVARGYSTLEYDLHAGTRGHRADHCRTLLAELTGAEDGLVVNNAAGALVLALNAVAAGKPVLISRGELIEIGGAFRIPEIMLKSGAVLHEIGTTNRTHLDDYRRGLEQGGQAILTVHRSNFEQVGFVHTPSPSELAKLAAEFRVPYVYDVGSGLLADLSPFGLTGEPRVQEAVATGADVVLFSGDKLLGGPQAGCLVGARAIIHLCRQNPFARALRADKLTLAALEATLSLYRAPAQALRDIPVLAMLTVSLKELERLAHQLAAAIPLEYHPEIERGASAVGGGSFPNAIFPTWVVTLDPGSIGSDGLALRLRLGEPSLVTRVQDNRVILDPRTIPETMFSTVRQLLEAVRTE
ncbi:MAG: L-seryl-tRNA(Sec) selenium transferase [Gemmatimonadota bacterium]